MEAAPYRSLWDASDINIPGWQSQPANGIASIVQTRRSHVSSASRRWPYCSSSEAHEEAASRSLVQRAVLGQVELPVCNRLDRLGTRRCSSGVCSPATLPHRNARIQRSTLARRQAGLDWHDVLRREALCKCMARDGQRSGAGFGQVLTRSRSPLSKGGDVECVLLSEP